ncbi:hypothetical protein GUITHDRAFT_41689, partial [Guillardia theta CCMP2712]
KEIEEDIQELKTLLRSSKRPRISNMLQTHLKSMEELAAEHPAAPAKASGPPPQKLPNAPTSSGVTTAYKDFESLMFLTDEYNSPTVTVYLELKNVGEFKDKVQCEFFVDRVDVKVLDINGVNYRRHITNLYKDIVPDESSFKVKKNRIELTLKKVKGEYSYETWNELCSKKRRDREKQRDPMNSIMELMQDMYEEGDDNTRKMIGEAMMKSRQGK